MNLKEIVESINTERLEKEDLEFQIANGHILMDVIGVERHDNLNARLQALTNFFISCCGDFHYDEKHQYRIDLFGNHLK